MATKKKSVLAVDSFSEEELEAARQFRSIKLAPLPKKLRDGDEAAQIRQVVRAYVRERMPRS